ncbi:MAG: hypothetical protein BGO26_19445 [Actinobacteria bacterium 69-20]|jgi:CubicO group peptidase (beta-lactamase class C family)|nr:beta-lactamase family protein [Actinomycetota bacterium]OJV24720.1 MAG: hypothetical protein BGO26_19445 [Actinobacteria bacterium 69-20]
MSTFEEAGPPLQSRASELADRLAALLDRFDVPGAAFALARGDELVTGAAGVLSCATQYPVTADSWFQIGSITKLFTATLVMQLVDDGLVALDEPVRTYLGAFDVGDEAASAAITVRHLLTHTSGIQGDYFGDFGRGADAVDRYVASLAGIDMLHRPGEFFSYCNPGFAVLGVLLQTMRGADFDSILSERLLHPLGIPGGTLADQAILHRVAIGHVPGPDGAPAVPAPRWAMPYSAGPAGSTPFTDPAGLVSFARLHMSGGLAPDGTRLLSQAAVDEMQRLQVAVPDFGAIEGIGASWIRYRWGDQTVLGHDGGTDGQFSFLRVHPPTGSVAVLLTNGPDGGRLFEAFAAPLFAGLAGAPVPEQVCPPADPPAVDVDRLAGTYLHYGKAVEVRVADGRVAATVTAEADESTGDPGLSETFDLVPHSQSTDAVMLVAAVPLRGTHPAVMFPAPAPGSDEAARYLRVGGRVFARSTA